MSLWAGQSVGLVHEIRPAGEIVATIVDGAVAALASLVAPNRAQ